jgi:hypothetical protein
MDNLKIITQPHAMANKRGIMDASPAPIVVTPPVHSELLIRHGHVNVVLLVRQQFRTIYPAVFEPGHIHRVV